jgi:hypothetical protein
MSDVRKQPDSSVPPARAVTNPGQMKVMSAARADPIAQEPKGPLGKHLAKEASNTALNGLSIVKEFIQDFRERDRFFKFKAMILASWVTLSALSIVVACPGQGLKTGALGARVVDPQVRGRPTLLIYNDSKALWKDVIFVVNGDYRASVGMVRPGEFVTLTPKQLMNSAGAAPADMPLRNLEIRVGDDKAMLLRDGQPVN